jgi:hypothetical protein
VAEPSYFSGEHRPWLEMLDEIGAPPHGLTLPDPVSIDAILARLEVAQPDAEEIKSFWPSPARDRELWWLLERAYHALVRDLGGFAFLDWPDIPAEYGATGRYFYAYVFLAALGDVRAYHAKRGIPDDVSWPTLADLGRNLVRDRRLFGEGGLRAHAWMTLHFRGALYALGRLQFNRMLMRFDEPAASVRPGDPVVGIHIPESGPLFPDACEDSYRRAREFFPRHFTETPVRIGVCTSWLLDPQLTDYLDSDTNIIRFQRRFHVVGASSDGDADIVRFVFKRLNASLDDLPQRTALERAIVTHLRSGRHWRNRTGWLEL